MLNLGTSPAHAILQLVSQRYQTESSPPPPSSSAQALRSLSRTLKVWLHDHTSGVISVAGVNAQMGRLLVQRGRVVHASLGGLPPSEAASALTMWMESTDITPIALSSEEVALACAALEGEIIHFRSPLDSDSMTWTLIENLCRTAFDGVLALERGRSLGVWRFSKGQMNGLKAFPAHPSGSRLTLVRWVERDLPPLGMGTFSSALQASIPGSPAEDSARVWKVFEREIHAQLDARAVRFISRMRQTHGHLQGEKLLTALSRELERSTGTTDLLAQVYRIG